jgi:hypothetical protein
MRRVLRGYPFGAASPSLGLSALAEPLRFDPNLGHENSDH